MPQKSPGDALADLWDRACDAEGWTVRLSHAELAKAWGVSKATVGRRLDSYAATGVLTSETLPGNQGSKIVFSRAPTEVDRGASRRTGRELVPLETGHLGKTPAGDPQGDPEATPGESPGVFQGRLTKGWIGGSKASRVALGPAARKLLKSLSPQEDKVPRETPSKVTREVTRPAEAGHLETADNHPANVVHFPLTMSPDGSGRVALRDTLEGDPETPGGSPDEVVHEEEIVHRERRVRLPLFRPANIVRLVASLAIVVGVAMIAWHSASAGGAGSFQWWSTLAAAIILCVGKVALGSLSGDFYAQGEKASGRLCLVAALAFLAADVSLLYAFRGDSLSNAAAQEQAAMESRERVKARLEGLLTEQRQLLAAQVSGAPAPVLAASGPVRVASSGSGPCTRVPAPWLRGKPEPVAPMEFGDCSAEVTALALQADLERTKVAASQVERAAVAAERRSERLAALPSLIEAAETELATTHARASSDHGASIVARGLNWIPAGISAVIWGEEFRPVGGRGVEIFWSWVFVFGVEFFSVFGFSLAAKADRRARRNQCQEL